VSEWDTYAQCKCRMLYRAPFGDRFHIHREVCSRCGLDKMYWEIVVAREVQTGNWWNPWSWASHWEYKD